jgi:hypothetical protein
MSLVALPPELIGQIVSEVVARDREFFNFPNYPSS